MAFRAAKQAHVSDALKGARGRRFVSRPCAIALAVALVVSVACGRVGFQDRVPDDGGRDPSSEGAAPTDASPDEATSEDGSPPGSEASVTDASSADGDASDAASDSPDGSSCPLAPAVDYCATVPLLPAPPVIDGTLDCGVSLRDLAPVDWTGGATPPDATAQYAVAWRPDGLYFFVRVIDPSLVPAEPAEFSWQGDEVELYMDSDGTYAAPPAYDDPGARQITIAAPSDALSSVARAQVWFPGSVGTTDWTSTQFRAYGRPDGYVVEAFVTGPDLGLSTLALAEGGIVGMDLSIGVSYPSDQGPEAGTGNRLGQYFLRIADPDAGGGVPPFDPRAFCRPTLAPAAGSD